MRADHERTREPVLAFLGAVSAADFGTDVEAWRAWIDGERTEGGITPTSWCWRK